MNILVPCFSNAPDRDHNAVVLTVDNELLGQLEARRRAFDLHKLADRALYAHEYNGGPVHYLNVDDGDYLDSPDGPVDLDERLRDLEIEGPWHLTDADNVYLKVVREGFFYTWDGREEKHAPSEIYESDTFTLAQLAALCRPIEPGAT